MYIAITTNDGKEYRTRTIYRRPISIEHKHERLIFFDYLSMKPKSLAINQLNYIFVSECTIKSIRKSFL